MCRTIILACCVVLLVFVGQVQSEDWYVSLATRAIKISQKLKDALPDQTDPRTMKKLTQEMQRFIDNFKIVQDKMNTGIEKINGAPVKKTRKAEDKAKRGIKKLENTIKGARKNRRKSEGEGNIVKELKNSISVSGKGVNEFLEGIKGTGPKGIAIALDVATAFEKVGDILAGSLAELA